MHAAAKAFFNESDQVRRHLNTNVTLEALYKWVDMLLHVQTDASLRVSDEIVAHPIIREALTLKLFVALNDAAKDEEVFDPVEEDEDMEDSVEAVIVRRKDFAMMRFFKLTHLSIDDAALNKIAEHHMALMQIVLQRAQASDQAPESSYQSAALNFLTESVYCAYVVQRKFGSDAGEFDQWLRHYKNAMDVALSHFAVLSKTTVSACLSRF
jgi:hypothetical protein